MYNSGYSGQFNPGLSVVVANGETESSVITTGGFVPTGIKTPAALTSTTMTMVASEAVDGDFVPVVDFNGDPIEIAVAVDQWIPLDPAVFSGFPFFKLVMGSAEGAERTLIMTLRG